MRLLILCFALNLAYASFAQSFVVGDSLKIDFGQELRSYKLVNSVDDLDDTILVTNLSDHAVQVYNELIFGNNHPSKLSNYYWKLYKKSRGFFTQISYTHDRSSAAVGIIQRDLFEEYGSGADSVFAVYDQRRTELASKTSRSLDYNILRDNVILDAGYYRYKVFMKIENIYKTNGGKKRIVANKFLSSGWKYIWLTKSLRANAKFYDEPVN